MKRLSSFASVHQQQQWLFMIDLTLMKLQNIKKKIFPHLHFSKSFNTRRTPFFFEEMQSVFVPLNDAEPDIDMKSIAKIYVWEVTKKKKLKMEFMAFKTIQRATSCLNSCYYKGHYLGLRVIKFNLGLFFCYTFVFW